ncbi:hypothetical protein TKK_0004751 [Trichogramma kaykai]
MQELFELHDDGDNMIVLNDDCFMDRAFKVVRFWRLFCKSGTRSNIDRFDPKTYFAKVPTIDGLTMCLCKQDVVESLFNPTDKLLKSLISTMLTGHQDLKTPECKLLNFVETHVSPAKDFDKWSYVCTALH